MNSANNLRVGLINTFLILLTLLAKSAWENSLKYQITGELPDYDSVKTDLKQLLQKIFS